MNFTANSSNLHPPISALSKIFPRGSLLALQKTFRSYSIDPNGGKNRLVNPMIYQKTTIRSASTNNPSHILETWLKTKSQVTTPDSVKLERSLSDVIAIATTNYFPSSFKRSESTEWKGTDVTSFTHFHVYSSGRVSETITFEFAPCANRVFYQVGAAKIILKEFSENVLNQSNFLGAATGNIVATALQTHQDMDQLFKKLLDEFVSTGSIQGSDVSVEDVSHDALTIKITVEPGMGNICPEKELGPVSPRELFSQGQEDAIGFLKTLQNNDLITPKLFFK